MLNIIQKQKIEMIKMSREECAAKGGSEAPIRKRTPKQQAQKNAFTARAQRAKNAQMGNQ